MNFTLPTVSDKPEASLGGNNSANQFVVEDNETTAVEIDEPEAGVMKSHVLTAQDDDFEPFENDKAVQSQLASQRNAGCAKKFTEVKQLAWTSSTIKGSSAKALRSSPPPDCSLILNSLTIPLSTGKTESQPQPVPCPSSDSHDKSYANEHVPDLADESGNMGQVATVDFVANVPPSSGTDGGNYTSSESILENQKTLVVRAAKIKDQVRVRAVVFKRIFLHRS